ncbi:MAG: phosphoribosylglycinamide formyltransferase [Methermicoccaceae archaeon]
MREKINIGVLVSGRGSNLQSIIDHIKSGYIPGARIAVVLSNKKDAYALERARASDIDAVFIDRNNFSSNEAYEEALMHELDSRHVGLVLLAGYMRVLGKEFIRHYPMRIINIHPALLPSFKGLHAQQQAFEYGVKVSGCTVHFVDEEVDHGPIILQKCVNVLDDDTADSLAERILEQEHKIFPEAVKLFVEGRLKIEGRKVKILSQSN